jgi:hypothetical protein
MSDQRPTCETMTIEEATVSNLWEIAGEELSIRIKQIVSRKDRPGRLNNPLTFCPVKGPNQLTAEFSDAVLKQEGII